VVGREGLKKGVLITEEIYNISRVFTTEGKRMKRLMGQAHPTKLD
jgi:hypothetical protein